MKIQSCLISNWSILFTVYSTEKKQELKKEQYIVWDTWVHAVLNKQHIQIKYQEHARDSKVSMKFLRYIDETQRQTRSVAFLLGKYNNLQIIRSFIPL